jgi:cell division protease FtsH
VRLPISDRVSLTRAKLEADLAVAMGGRVAEELVMGAEGTTTGAAVDIKQATRLARRMVAEWGMSDVLGPLAYVDTEDGGQPTGETARLIDAEVKRIVEDAKHCAKSILQSRRSQLDAVARALLERETLTAAEVAGAAEHPLICGEQSS